MLTVLTGAILVPFQLSRLEQVRLFTEGNANDSNEDDVLGLDLIPLTGTTTTLTDKTIKVSSLFSITDVNGDID